MRVLFAASEVQPFAKTGGLADVAGALPRALHRLGVDVAVVLPLYRKVRDRGDPVEVVAERVPCPFAGSNRPFRLLRTAMPGAPDLPVWLIENPGVFEAEDAFYGSEPGSYGDGHLRFLYFARAILRVPEAAGFTPDVFHLNDWQTSLVAPLLRCVHRGEDPLSGAATVLTIHNLAYQGAFPVDDLRHAGIPDFLIREGRLLEAGLGNLLAGGIRYADAVTTVSRTYAEEILTPEFGNGLEGLLHWRRPLLKGIVNGLDVEEWDPETDPHLAAPYDADDLSGKARCRQALLEECGLAPTDGPVFGIVSRLVAQKGLAMVPPIMDEVLARHPDARLVVLGSGEPDLEAAFSALAAARPEQAHVRLAFDAPFSHRVEAGADLFVMPSRFEPCGLNQLISMRYGTPPIVHRVGGLRDTVVDADGVGGGTGRATGIGFDGFHPAAFADAVRRAIELFWQRDRFREVQRNGMSTDWSWERSAREYLRTYREALERHADGAHLEPLLEGLPPEPLEVDLPPLAEIPEGYARDLLMLMPLDPWTLFCQWELGGDGSRERFEAIPAAERDGATLELVLTDAASGESRRHDVGGLTRQWFATVEPGHAYEAALWFRVPGREGVRLLDHAAVTMPVSSPGGAAG